MAGVGFWFSTRLVIFLHIGAVSAVFEGEVRLTGNNCHAEGRVEIYHTPSDNLGRWGTVCFNGFSETEAKATCRQLGYHNGATLRPQGEPQVDVWLSVLECSPHAHNLTDCLTSNLVWDGADYTRDCGGQGTAGVHCSNTDDELNCEGKEVKPNGGVKTNGTCAWEGQLFYYTRQRWVEICADGFNDNDATVACRQMGYKRGWAIHILIATSQKSSSGMMSNINCRGDEVHLINCPTDQTLHTKCKNDNDVSFQRAAVSCSNSTDRIPCDVPLNETCYSMHCHGRGTCIDGPGGGVCQCPHFLHGKNCEQEVTPCSPNPCQNNGTCSETPAGYICACSSGFSGSTCQKGSTQEIASILQPGLRAGIGVLVSLVLVVIIIGVWCVWRRRRRGIPRRRLRNEVFRELSVSEVESEDPGQHRYIDNL